MMGVIQFGDPLMSKITSASTMEGDFNVSWIKLWLFPLGLVLANLKGYQPWYSLLEKYVRSRGNQVVSLNL